MKKHSKLIVSVIGVLVILIVVLTGSKTYESHEQLIYCVFSFYFLHNL